MIEDQDDMQARDLLAVVRLLRAMLDQPERHPTTTSFRFVVGARHPMNR